MSVIYYITFLSYYHASLGYRDSLSINALFAQTPPPPGPLSWTKALRSCQSSGWAGPQGAILYTCGHRHLKIKPPAGLGAPPWLTRVVLGWVLTWASCCLVLKFSRPSLSCWEVRLETRGMRNAGEWTSFSEEAPSCSGPGGLEEYVEFPNLAFRNCFV